LGGAAVYSTQVAQRGRSGMLEHHAPGLIVARKQAVEKFASATVKLAPKKLATTVAAWRRDVAHPAWMI
jgi:hypothetical protein